VKPAVCLSVAEFCRSVKTNRIFTDLEDAFSAAGRSVAQNERQSWQGSLPRLSGALELAALPGSTYIGLEVQVPYYSERIDAVLYGHDAAGSPFTVLVELKQWSAAELAGDGRLLVGMRGGPVAHAHPSFQVDGYRRHLGNFVKAFHNQPVVNVDCCVYAHNYPSRTGPLFDAQYSDVMVRAPVFSAVDAESLATFLAARLGEDRGAEIVDRVRREGIAPSKLLAEHASEAIRRQDVFTMLGEQIPAQRNIIQAITDATRAKSKSIILVEGGPGTGKSVIALDAVGHALRAHRVVHLVSGSAAFTHGMRRLLGPEIAALVRFTDFFWEHEESSVDVLIVDEAHRIRRKSEPKVVSARRPKISQLEELIRAAKVTVLFMDTNQIIQPDEHGDPAAVEEVATRLGIKLRRHQLRAQFRCDGSDEYLKWADALFALDERVVAPTAPRRAPVVEVREDTSGYALDLAALLRAGRLKSPATFDFAVVDSPHEVLAWVRKKNEAEPNSARLTAGWCWPWSDPRPDRSLVHDIVIGDFTFPWELKSGKRGPPGVPEAKHWPIDPGGAEQAGTVYSVQGFEFRHVGVIMGPDLVIRGGRWVAQPRENHRNGLRAKPPEVASIFLRRIYRTLFTRAMRSLRVFSVDEETREFLRSRVERQAGPGR
jgi:hypothetical protein